MSAAEAPVHVATLVLVAGVLALPRVAPAAEPAPAAREASRQEAPAAPDRSRRTAAAVRPESVRVGEPFTLGVTVRAEPGVELSFPAYLETGQDLEQLAPARVRAEEDTWRAYYRLTAWRPGRTELPSVSVSTREGARVAAVSSPALVVQSVLPSDGEDLELRGARPYLGFGRPLWAWILVALGLLLLGLALWRWRRGERERPAPEPADDTPPEERAMRSLEALVRRWDAGQIAGGAYFDEWEAILRRYAEATRSWPAGAPLRELADGYRSLAHALDRSTLVRFARASVDRHTPRRAADAAAGWIRGTAATRQKSEAGEA